MADESTVPHPSPLVTVIRAVLMPGERAASEPVGPERAEVFIYLFPGDELRD